MSENSSGGGCGLIIFIVVIIVFITMCNRSKENQARIDQLEREKIELKK
jgi:septation ring formation regulator EzrA